ncbi:MAG: hypothetical protein ACFCUV_22575 [Rivularia sp. (in: cyanobacteria)]
MLVIIAVDYCLREEGNITNFCDLTQLCLNFSCNAYYYTSRCIHLVQARCDRTKSMGEKLKSKLGVFK